MIPQLMAASAKLKIGLKEYKMLSTYEWQPCRPVCIYNREIKHIHYFTIKTRWNILHPSGHETRNL